MQTCNDAHVPKPASTMYFGLIEGGMERTETHNTHFLFKIFNDSDLELTI